MKASFNIALKKWLIVYGLLLLTSITPVVSVYAADLTGEETKWLTYMCEEEKLARDVYMFLYNKWGARIFRNISLSEQKHMDALKTLLDRHQINDPTNGNDQGEFTDETLQKLYSDLIEKGELTLVDALKVGVFIEETDIADLKAGISSTTRRDIKKVYGNLMQGSSNHLDAFCSNLSSTGENAYCK